MKKQVFIINGHNGVGKDTFVKLFEKDIDEKKTLILNYSSVAKVKQLALFAGWDGEKTERSRKFLSDLKLLTTEYNDMSFEDMKETMESFNEFAASFNKIAFLHIREPEEITKAKNEFNAKTILVTRDSANNIANNMADENVFNYDYDIVIENNGTLEELQDKVIAFASDFEKDVLKERY